MHGAGFPKTPFVAAMRPLPLIMAFLLWAGWASPSAGQIVPFPAGFQVREIAANGATIHIRVGGPATGPAVLLLHGYGETGDMWAPQLDSTEALHTELRHFVRCIEHGQAPLTGGEVGLRIVEILETATRSMAERGRPIELEKWGVPA